MACLILFIDFSKAFDSVHIPSLIVKLEKMGVRGKMLALIKAFLEDRAGYQVEGEQIQRY